MDKKVLMAFVVGMAEEVAAKQSLEGTAGAVVGRSMIYAALSKNRTALIDAALGKTEKQSSEVAAS